MASIVQHLTYPPLLLIAQCHTSALPPQGVYQQQCSVLPPPSPPPFPLPPAPPPSLPPASSSTTNTTPDTSDNGSASSPSTLSPSPLLPPNGEQPPPPGTWGPPGQSTGQQGGLRVTLDDANHADMLWTKSGNLILDMTNSDLYFGGDTSRFMRSTQATGGWGACTPASCLACCLA